MIRPATNRSTTILDPSGRPFGSDRSFLVVPGPADVSRANALRRDIRDLFPKLVEELPHHAYDDTLRRLRRHGADGLLDTEHGRVLSVDAALHDRRDGGRSVAQRFADRAPPELREAARALSRTRYGLFRVGRAVGSGVRLFDALAGDAFVVLGDDVQFAEAQVIGWLVARLAPHGPFQVVAGPPTFAPPILDNDAMVEFIEEIRYDVLRACARGAMEERETPLRLVRAAMELQDSWGIGEEEELDAPPPPRTSAGERNRLEEDPAPVRTPRKVGRNEPCPCGSGRKYKRCCGP